MSLVAPPRDFHVRLIELFHAASIEIPAKPELVEPLRGAFDPGTEVFINQPPSGDYRAAVATAVALRRAGFQPVAHVSVRNMASVADVDDYLARLVGEAAADRVLLVSGDQRLALGPFASVVDLLAGGRVEAAGIRAVGFAGHPESPSPAAAAARDRDLIAKRDGAAKAGLAAFVVTQFCFEAQPILAFLDRMGRLGIDLPVRVGVAAPASVPTLIKFAVRCGVGASLRTLQAQPKTVGRLIGDSGPEDLLRDLAVGLAKSPSDRVLGIHLYAFGGVAKTADWVGATLSRLYNAITVKAAGA